MTGCVNIEGKLVARGHVSGCVTRNSQQLYIPYLKHLLVSDHSSTELSVCGKTYMKTANYK